MPVIYLAFGSNLGRRRQTILRAVEKLELARVHVEILSTMIETEPVGGPFGQGLFLNCVARARTELPPGRLLTAVAQVEKELGRTRAAVNGPRTIDIDILLYDNLHINTPELTVPHPRMRIRDFVMIPLREINPGLADQILNADQAMPFPEKGESMERMNQSMDPGSPRDEAPGFRRDDK
jgi:2-amino-4-hydroxy-6-hydroxymethyldihydropteridine diphosphokinase